jgi:hypothetical protein
MMPVAPIPRPKLKAAPAPSLQAQFDVLAESFARALVRIDALERKIKLPKRLAAVEEFTSVVPATENAPARRVFDAASFLGAIAERQRG